MKLNKTWRLPPPERTEDKFIWRPIPRLTNSLRTPWGYEIDPEDEYTLLPIVSELAKLEEAKELIKRFSQTSVAQWLSGETGRPISTRGLTERIKHEQKVKRQGDLSRQFQRIAEEAAKKAEKYENKIGGRYAREYTSPREGDES